MNIYEKLMNVQANLKAPKGQYNSFGKYKYRSCEDIVESVKPLLKQYGLMLCMTDEVIQVGERFYIKATATVFDIADGNVVVVSALAREEACSPSMTPRTPTPPIPTARTRRPPRQFPTARLLVRC